MQNYNNTCKILAHHIKTDSNLLSTPITTGSLILCYKKKQFLHLFHQCHLHSF